MNEKTFAVLNTDEELVCDVVRGAFTVGIREIVGVGYLVGVFYDGDEYHCGIYRELDEATEAVSEVLSFEPNKDATAFMFPKPTEPVTALEIIDAMSAQEVDLS